MSTKNIEIQSKKKIRYTINFECLCQKYNPNVSTVFGKIFNLEIHGRYNEFRGSIDFLAARSGLSYATTLRIVKLLLKENLIRDITPETKRSQRMQTRHYKTNQDVLLVISNEMNVLTDEELLMRKSANETKKKIIQSNVIEKQKLNILELLTNEEDEYENPFDEDDEI